MEDVCISQEELFNLLDNSAFRHILNQLTVGISFVDIDGCILFFNNAILNMYNFDKKSIKYRKTHIEDLFVTSTCTREVLQNGHTNDSLSIAINGTQGISHRIPIFNSDGEVIACLAQNIVGSATPKQFEELQNLMSRLQTIVAGPNSMMKANNRYPLHTVADIIGSHQRMIDLKADCMRFANSRQPVLISGESGTGKELFAQALHMASPRGSNQFISVNCGALPAQLVESELFGYVAGSFTNANQKGMKGKFEAANGGSIFLDEIAELPLSSQATLLRVLESGEIQKIGSTSCFYSDFRLIAATNRNLRELCDKGLFRKDLFYRISVFELNIPPLREHLSDIEELSGHFISSLRKNAVISDEVTSMLKRMDWEGNIRELKNVLTYASCRMDANENEISPSHLPSYCHDIMNDKPLVLCDSLQKTERDHIVHALMRNKYNKSLAAKDLGISRPQLYKRMRALGISTKFNQ